MLHFLNGATFIHLPGNHDWPPQNINFKSIVNKNCQHEHPATLSMELIFRPTSASGRHSSRTEIGLGAQQVARGAITIDGFSECDGNDRHIITIHLVLDSEQGEQDTLFVPVPWSWSREDGPLVYMIALCFEIHPAAPLTSQDEMDIDTARSNALE
ncbi:hypothetical protein BT63DRAFT_471750 [Microthyrium microscopicum]|uniref:Uncharacterized protein n=1 Tax=Microthyrium microscopicum TaxID=703497 RepID=A0A6A6U8T3_9PEZI|nr:hypothetical protein BT63DRAFT_471750 [Microthyrium microscopicum]